MELSDINCEYVNGTVKVHSMFEALSVLRAELEQKQFTCHAVVVYVTSLHGLLTLRKVDDPDSEFQFWGTFIQDGTGPGEWGLPENVRGVSFEVSGSSIVTEPIYD